MNFIYKEHSDRVSSPLLSGLIYSFIVMGITTLVTSLLLTLTNQDEHVLPTYAFIIHALSLSIGGWMAGKRSGKKGWYYGGICGTIYGIIILLVGFLGFDQGIDLQALLLLAGSFVVSAIGGMLGVNTSK